MQGEVKDEDFRTYFEQFGEIEDCVVSLQSADVATVLWQKFLGH